jgi:hypothetical protein
VFWLDKFFEFCYNLCVILGHAIYRRTDPKTGQQYAGQVWWTKPNQTPERACARRWKTEDRDNGMAGWISEIVSAEKRSDAPYMSDGLYRIRMFVNEAAEFDKIPPENRKNKIHPLLQLNGVSAREEMQAIGRRISGFKNKKNGTGIFAPGMAAKGGRIAGRTLVELKRGIFAPGFDLANGGRTYGHFGGRVAGRKARDLKLGIFSPEFDRADAGRIGRCSRWQIDRGLPCVCGHHLNKDLSLIREEN